MQNLFLNPVFPTFMPRSSPTIAADFSVDRRSSASDATLGTARTGADLGVPEHKSALCPSPSPGTVLPFLCRRLATAAAPAPSLT